MVMIVLFERELGASASLCLAQINKTARNDARGLAQIVRAGLYRPVHVIHCGFEQSFSSQDRPIVKVLLCYRPVHGGNINHIRGTAIAYRARYLLA